jgi:prevent-host-death family protein
MNDAVQVMLDRYNCQSINDYENALKEIIQEIALLARSKLYRLIDEASSSHEPIVITGKRGNAVLISEDDWRSIQETLYLLSIPGMPESIREGLATPIEECTEELDW